LFLRLGYGRHPQTADRIERSQEEIAKIPPRKAEYKLNTSEFDHVKARLAALKNKRKMTDEKDSKKPSLRRSSSTDKNGSNDTSENDDGRPPLKRPKKAMSSEFSRTEELAEFTTCSVDTGQQNEPEYSDPHALKYALDNRDTCVRPLPRLSHWIRLSGTSEE
jgi:hypothetical protein